MLIYCPSQEWQWCSCMLGMHRTGCTSFLGSALRASAGSLGLVCTNCLPVLVHYILVIVSFVGGNLPDLNLIAWCVFLLAYCWQSGWFLPMQSNLRIGWKIVLMTDCNYFCGLSLSWRICDRPNASCCPVDLWLHAKLLKDDGLILDRCEVNCSSVYYYTWQSQL